MRQLIWLVVGVGLFGFAPFCSTAGAADADAEMPVLLEEDFESGMNRWQSTDPDPADSVWQIVEADTGSGDADNHVLRVTGMSKYQPPYRSPHSIAWLKDVKVGDFELTARVQNTNPSGGNHRDLCIFWGRQSPSEFYYVHFGAKADPHACQIFIVNNDKRTMITKDQAEGTLWSEGWHNIKITRNLGDGTVKVYFDDMTKPLMTAQDTTFGAGEIGLGTFDDSGNFDEVVLRGERVANSKSWSAVIELNGKLQSRGARIMSVTRREFLGTSAAAASMAALGLSWAGRAMAQDTADIRLAQIGFNGQGKGHIDHNHRNLVALCDVDEKVLHGMADRLDERYGHKLDTYTDFRKLLERKDIDAVSIATPNHTHAWIAIAAAQAGKHVYVEKPASHNIWEGRQMIQAARQNNRLMQCGTQSRSSSSLKDAVAFVRNGELGKINYALGTCYKPRPSIGKLDKPLEIPSTLNYDLWCGPAAKEDLYRSRVHYDWHWVFNTGNGDMGNQGIHQMDIARWFLGESQLAPRAISIGGRLGYEDAGNTPNTQIVFLDYPAAPLIFETRGLPRSEAAQKRWGESMDRYRGSRIGVIVQCERGYVLVPSYVEAIAYDNDGHEIKHWQISDDSLGNHIRNFLSAVAANDPSRLNADIQEGHLSSSLCHLGGISHQLGKGAQAGDISEQIKGDELLSISFDRMASHLRANGVDIDGEESLTFGPWLELDPATEVFTGNDADAANELRSRKQRDPYIVPDLERSAVAKAS